MTPANSGRIPSFLANGRGSYGGGSRHAECSRVDARQTLTQ